MLKKRLITIASFVKKDAFVIDVGTDHAYLPIYLYQNDITKKIIATDISPNALEIAQKNLDKAHIYDIKLICTDGLNNIKEDFDTVVISGMGTSTIMKILDNQELPNNIILSSNNDYYKLRKFMNLLGYQIKREEVVCENDKYYDIIAYEKGFERLSKVKLKYGISHNKEYYKYLYQKNKSIFKRASFGKKFKLINELIILKFLTI